MSTFMDGGGDGQHFTGGETYGAITNGTTSFSTSDAQASLHAARVPTEAWYAPEVGNSFNTISSSTPLDPHGSDLHRERSAAHLYLATRALNQPQHNMAEPAAIESSIGTSGGLTVAPVSTRKRGRNSQKRRASKYDRESISMQDEPMPMHESDSVVPIGSAEPSVSNYINGSRSSSDRGSHHPASSAPYQVKSPFGTATLPPAPRSIDDRHFFETPSLKHRPGIEHNIHGAEGYPYSVGETQQDGWAFSIPASPHGSSIVEGPPHHLNANYPHAGPSSSSMQLKSSHFLPTSSPISMEYQGSLPINRVIYNDQLIGSNLIRFETNGIPLLIDAFPLCSVNCSLDVRRDDTRIVAIRNCPPASIGCSHSATLGTMCLARYISENVPKTDKANIIRNSLCISEPGAATYVQAYSVTSSSVRSCWSIIPRCDVPRALERLEAKGLSPENQTTTLDPHQFEDLISIGITIYAGIQNIGDILCLPPGVLYQATEIHSAMEFRTWQTYSLPTVAHAFQHNTRVQHRLCCDNTPPYRRMLYGYLQAVQRSLDEGKLQSPETVEYAPGTIQQSIKLFDRLLVEEFTQGTRDHEARLEDAGYCDFCGADIFHAAFVCSNSLAASGTSKLPSECCEVKLCPACCAEGRSCTCGKLRLCSVFEFEQLVSTRNRIAEWCIVSLGSTPTLISRFITMEDIYEDTEHIHLALGAISILNIRRFPSFTDKSENGANMTVHCKGGPAACEQHEISRLQSVTCDRCHETICFPHLLAIGIHAAEAAFRLEHGRDWHYIHSTWAPHWLEWKRKGKKSSHPSDTMTRLASTKVKCCPLKPEGLRLGCYDHPSPTVICERYEDDPILKEDINELLWNQDTRHSSIEPSHRHAKGAKGVKAIPSVDAEGAIHRKRKRKTADGAFSLKPAKKPKRKSKLSIAMNISTAETTADEATSIPPDTPLEEIEPLDDMHRHTRLSVSSSNFDMDAEEVDVDEPVVLDDPVVLDEPVVLEEPMVLEGAPKDTSTIEHLIEIHSEITTDVASPSSPADNLPLPPSSPELELATSNQSSVDLSDGFLQKFIQQEEANKRLVAQVSRLTAERDNLEARIFNMNISAETSMREIERFHNLEHEHQLQIAHNKTLEEEVQRLRAFKITAARELETMRKKERDYDEEKNRSKDSKGEVQRLKVQLFGVRESHGKLKEELSLIAQRRDKEVESLRADKKRLETQLESSEDQLNKAMGVLETKNLELINLKKKDSTRMSQGSSVAGGSSRAHKSSSSKPLDGRPQGSRKPISKKPSLQQDEDDAESEDGLLYNPLDIAY